MTHPGVSDKGPSGTAPVRRGNLLSFNLSLISSVDTGINPLSVCSPQGRSVHTVRYFLLLTLISCLATFSSRFFFYSVYGFSGNLTGAHRHTAKTVTCLPGINVTFKPRADQNGLRQTPISLSDGKIIPFTGMSEEEPACRIFFQRRRPFSPSAHSAIPFLRIFLTLSVHQVFPDEHLGLIAALPEFIHHAKT